ncbi:MAG: MCE family protein [Leptospiraceae bacterium]|nr:MCE family protein [Leptospiraceae bacterium]MCP5497335.1 MCE family protein [Leptospiraceae bacterium]
MKKYYIIGLSFFFLLGLSFYETIVKKNNTKALYPYNIKLYFSRTDGLKEGTTVAIMGVPVGIIKSVKKVSINEIKQQKNLDPGYSEAIELEIITAQPVAIWENYEVKFQKQSIFSDRMINIYPGNSDGEAKAFYKPEFKPNEERPVEEISATYYEDFFMASTQLVKENQQDFRKIVNNLKDVSYKLKYGNGTLPQLINNDKLYSYLKETSEDVGIFGKEARWYAESNRETGMNLTPFSLVVISHLMGFSILNNVTNY